MDLRTGVLGKVANTITVWGIQLGIPRPPYTRNVGAVIETIGRRSGKRRRIPVGYLEDEGKLIVVVEDGPRADWVRNALARDGSLRVHYHGRWRDARLNLVEGDPETYLQRMNSIHAHFLRHHSSTPQVAEITLE